MRTHPNGLSIGEAEALITDATSGKYKQRNPFRHELSRALAFAQEVWGPNTHWESIQEKDWTTLINRRLDPLLASGKRGVRSTEITVARLITTVGWLRKNGYLEPSAGQWPRDWKSLIRERWKKTKNTTKDPTPFQPRYSQDEARAILREAVFDPRFELLMWLGMEQRLGQVARVKRSDLVLDDLSLSSSHGTLTVRGRGNLPDTIIDLTADQRKVLDRALRAGGYLASIERDYRATIVHDYHLFPTGYVSGRVGLLRGKKTSLALSAKADFRKCVTASWIRKAFRTAEERAGIEHVAGRCAFGVRRGSMERRARASLFSSLSRLSPDERRILDRSSELLPTAAASYRQALDDLASGPRHSYRGTSSELRETLRELLDHLAPDDQVMKQPGFRLEIGLRGPTMKQKVRHVLASRGQGRTERESTEHSVALVEELSGAITRAVYDRASLAAHTQEGLKEINRLKRYVDTVLSELLDG